MVGKKKWLAAAIAGALASPQPSEAALITVNSASDPAFTGGATCTLRAAISAANSNAAVAGCAAGDVAGIDVIEFSPTLTGSTISLQQGQLEISSSLTIDAAGSFRGGVTIDGGGTSRIFRIFDLHNSTVQQVTLRQLTLINGFITNGDGGAIENVGENVAIDACTLIGNTADFGQAGLGGRGGGIRNASGQVNITDSTISGNTADRGGGGVANYISATTTLTNTTLSDNVAVFGGAISSIGVFDYSPSRLVMTGGVISGNSAEFGGGLFFRGTVELTGVTLSGNSSEDSGGAAAFDADGTTVLMTDVTLSGNSAGTSGGAISSDDNMQLNLEGSRLIDNSAATDGGGVHSTGTLTISDSTISGNSAGLGSSIGGGLYIGGLGSLSVSNSRIEGNAAARGAGIYAARPVDLLGTILSSNSASLSGGALYVRDAATITRSTISGNTAADGAAFFSLDGTTSVLTNTTVSNNISVGETSLFPAAIYAFAPIALVNSTLLNNAPNAITKANGVDFWSLTNTVIAGSAMIDCVDTITPVNINLNSFIGDGSCAAGAVDLLTGDPMLGPLADNGGATQTHLPQSGSPLVDAGNNSDCPSVDQTGMPRPVDGNADDDPECDIGSIEFVDLFPPLATLTSAPDVVTAGASSYPLEVTYTELDGAVDFASIDPADLTLTPGPLTVQGVTLAGTPGQLVATYTIQPPGGAWDPADSGDYNVAVNANQVLDTATTGTNAVVARSLGGFSVAIVDLDVTGNDVSIADGDSSPDPADGTAFGIVATGASLNRNFVLQNVGGGSLTLTAALEVFGAGFSITQPAETTLGPGQSTEFSITFTPASAGQVTGQVTILSDDADENPYTFAISGSASDDPQTALIFADGFESP